ncbi:MAG: hypothetical protein UV60_C0042G0010, partial [Parcubacteria group bacterium GW2011_GWA2_43_11]
MIQTNRLKHSKFSLKKTLLVVMVLGFAFVIIFTGVFILWASTLTMPTVD